MVADSGSRLVVADAEALPAVRAAVAAVTAALDGDASALDDDLVSRAVRPRVVAVGDRARARARSATTTCSPARPGRCRRCQDPEKLAALLYTSGTSGRPRAAMLTHRALLANIEQVARVEPPMIHGDDVVLGVLPLFHVYGLNAVLGGVLRAPRQAGAGRAVRPESPCSTSSRTRRAACCRSRRPSSPTGCRSTTCADRLGPVRLVLSGSAPLAPEVVDAFTGAHRRSRSTRATA